jgi:hypothetical protein
VKRILFAIYPFLIASYPILALRNHNIAYVDLASIVRTLLLANLLTALIWLLLDAIVFRDWQKSGIAASLAMILVLSYGHLHIESAAIFGEPIHHSFLTIILAVLYIVFTWLAIRAPSSVQTARTFLAVSAVVLVSMNLGQSLYYDFTTLRASRAMERQSSSVRPSPSRNNLPDIYLIVLDAHGRHDVLQEKFGYDNSNFIQGLQDLGFYVATCSQSNYAATNLSLSSLFNSNYIPAQFSSSARLPPLKESVVGQTLRSLGYTFITFENRTSGHFDLQEDIRLSKNQLLLGQLNLTGGINEFEEMILQTSILKLFWDTELIPGFNQKTLVRLENFEHYQQTRFILSDLKNIPQMKSPKFVFVHILVPHGPFVFTADGKFKSREDRSRNGYGDNAKFIDQNILASLQSMIAASPAPPVIVLMGDHGPPTGKYATREDRMKILNAYYVDKQTGADLYDSITPVNSFRVIFNDYFGESYPLLEDVSHYAYKLKQLKSAPIVANTCPPSK